jgi:hypothetical protein
MNELIQKIRAGIDAEDGQAEVQDEAMLALLALVSHLASLEERLKQAAEAWVVGDAPALNHLLLGVNDIEGI